MTRKEHERLKLLNGKQRLELSNRYVMTDEEKKELQKLKEDYESLDNTIGKAIFYMHDFLGISFSEIAEILNYTYQSARNRYYEIKSIIVVD